MVGASNFLGRFFPLIIAAIVVIYMAIKRYHKTERGRRVIDGLMLKLPVVGMLVRKIAVARFCRTLSMP